MAFMERAWPKTKTIASRAQMSASQVPGEEAFHADDEVLTIGSDDLERRFGSRLHMMVKHDHPVLI